MDHPAPPGLTGVVDGLLAELTELKSWIADLTRDLAASERKQVSLANALDNALAALSPVERRDYDHHVLKAIGDIGPKSTGRPPADNRQEEVVQYLAEWPEQLITVAEIRLMLERKRLACGKNYASGLLKKLERRGFLMRTGHGRYRVTRYHPHLIARRHGMHESLEKHRRSAQEAQGH